MKRLIIPKAICPNCGGDVEYWQQTKYEPGDWYCMNDLCRSQWNDNGAPYNYKHTIILE